MTVVPPKSNLTLGVKNPEPATLIKQARGAPKLHRCRALERRFHELRFERRYLRYWMENGSQSAIRPYLKVANDKRGARHGVAWLTEAYLQSHGVTVDATGV